MVFERLSSFVSASKSFTPAFPSKRQTQRLLMCHASSERHPLVQMALQNADIEQLMKALARFGATKNLVNMITKQIESVPSSSLALVCKNLSPRVCRRIRHHVHLYGVSCPQLLSALSPLSSTASDTDTKMIDPSHTVPIQDVSAFSFNFLLCRHRHRL